MKNFLKLMRNYLPILGTSFLIGCGDKNPLERPTTASGTFSSEVATNFGASFGDSLGTYTETAIDGGEAISQTSNAFSGSTDTTHKLRSENFFSSLQPFSDSSCEPTITGDTTDADEDSIAVNKTSVAKCSATLLGITFNISGTTTVQDKDDNNDYGGFIFTMSDIDVSFSNSSISANLYAEGTNSAGKHTGKFDFVNSINREGVPFKMGIFIDTVVTPEDTENPRDNGTIDSISGFMSLEGTYDSTTYNVVTAVSGTNLIYDRTNCSDRKIKSGTITFTDGSSNRLEVIYNDCEVTYEYNDSVVTPTRDIK